MCHLVILLDLLVVILLNLFTTILLVIKYPSCFLLLLNLNIDCFLFLLKIIRLCWHLRQLLLLLHHQAHFSARNC